MEFPSAVGVLSTPPSAAAEPAVGTLALAARLSFFKRGLGVWPASSSLPRSSLRLLCAPPPLLPLLLPPPAAAPEAPPPAKALPLSGEDGMLPLPLPLPLHPPPPRADDDPEGVAAAAAAAAAARKTAGSAQNLRALVPVLASILAWRLAIFSEVKEVWSQSQSGWVHPEGKEMEGRVLSGCGRGEHRARQTKRGGER